MECTCCTYCHGTMLATYLDSGPRLVCPECQHDHVPEGTDEWTYWARKWLAQVDD